MAGFLKEEREMFRIRNGFLSVGLVLIIMSPGACQSPVIPNSGADYKLVSIAEGLQNPWSMAFLPNGDMLITERPGPIRERPAFRDGGAFRG